MQPQISEFSFGYTVTDELINHSGLVVTAAPVFPTLFAEGQAGGGWDVQLQRPNVPLFLQFKLSHKLTRANAKQYGTPGLSLPYFRVHIWNRRKSDQQNLLIQLEQTGAEVYYVAPAFHTADEFNDAYLSRRVLQESIFFEPSVIGELTDDEDHYVCFDHQRWPYPCSTPRRAKRPADLASFQKKLEAACKGQKSVWTVNDCQQLLERVVSIAGRFQSGSLRKFASLLETRPVVKPEAEDTLSEVATLLHRVAYIAKTFFDCEMLLASKRR